MLDRIFFLLGEAFIALRRNGWMTFAAISTVAVSLFLLGGLGYVYLQVANAAQNMTGRFELRVMLKDGSKNFEISKTAADIRAIPGVKPVNWIPRDKAWQKFLTETPEHQKYVDIENPYPDSFKVILSDLKQTDQVIAKIKSFPAVSADEIQYLKSEQNLYVQIQAIVKWLGTALGGLLFVTGGILIYNAIRLSVLSRRLEIRNMQLVGASFLTIRIPFYIEGMVQGFVGGLLATLLLRAGHAVVDARVTQIWTTLPVFPTTTFLGILCAMGSVYGLICSMVAVRAPLRFR